MTSKQRTLAALHLQKPDRTPFIELGVDMGIATRVIEYRLGAGTPYSISNIIEAFGMDGYGERMYPRIYTRNKVNEQGRSYIIGGKITGAADLAMVDPGDEYLHDECFDHIKRFAEEMGNRYFAYAATNIGLDPVLLGMGLDNFSYCLADEPDAIEKMLDIYTEWAARVVEKLCGTGVDAIWFTDDIAFNTSLMFAPSFFREVCLPYLKRVTDACSLPILFHSDGNITDVVGDLISIGVNAIHPIEPGAMDIEATKTRFGDKLCLIGNLDLRTTLVTGSLMDVKNEVFDRLEKVGKNGGYIISSANTITDYCKLENVASIRAFIDEYYELGMDPG